MDCQTCQKQIEQWLFKGSSAGDENRQRWREHLKECHSCRDLFQELMDPSWIKMDSHDEGLTQKILSKTSKRKKTHITLSDPDLLTPFDRKHQEYHIFHCSYCRNLLEVEKLLIQDLPLLAQQQVPEELTNRLFAIDQGRTPRWLVWLRRCWVRPRFALELSYGMAMFLWLFWILVPVDSIVTKKPIRLGREKIAHIARKTDQQMKETMTSWSELLQQQKETYSQWLVSAGKGSRNLTEKANSMTKDLIEKTNSKLSRIKENANGKHQGNEGKPNEPTGSTGEHRQHS